MKSDFNFIIPEDKKFNKDMVMPASYIRKTFELSSECKEATLKITALGVYKAYINGQEIDKRMLLPGFTNYKARVQYQTYEITERLHKGKNVISVISEMAGIVAALGSQA